MSLLSEFASAILEAFFAPIVEWVTQMLRESWGFRIFCMLLLLTVVILIVVQVAR